MKEKEQYLTPESEALEMRLEGVIASSAGVENYIEQPGRSW